MDLTPQEIILAIVILAVVVVIIGFIFKTLFKVAIVAATCILLFGVAFGWLPAQLEAIRNGDKTGGEIINEVGNSVPVDEITNTFDNVVEVVTDPAIRQSAWDTATSLFQKIWHVFFLSDNSADDEPVEDVVGGDVDPINP